MNAWTNNHEQQQKSGAKKKNRHKKELTLNAKTESEKIIHTQTCACY